MTENLATRESSASERNLLRGWGSVIFAPVGSGQRPPQPQEGREPREGADSFNGVQQSCGRLLVQHDLRSEAFWTNQSHHFHQDMRRKACCTIPWRATHLLTILRPVMLRLNHLGQ